MHTNANILFKKYGTEYFKPGQSVLEIAPDTFPSSLEKLVSIPDINWDTLELDESFSDKSCNFSSVNQEQVKIITKDPYNFPIDDASYDVVISAFVIEHVPRVWIWVQELSRILKKGGHLITIAPTSWPYHEAPVDCWRIYPEAMKALYEEADLDVLVCENDGNELDQSKRHFPGWTYDGSWKNKLKVMMGWPVTAAYDTIAVGAKR